MLMLFLVSCAKDSEKQFQAESIGTTISHIGSPGIMHNEILDLYYSQNNLRDEVSLSDKIAVVDQYFVSE